MIFTPTEIDGVKLICLEKHTDERGFFARSYCQQEFGLADIHDNFSQCNISYNAVSATLRGMHYQSADAPESKLVRCIKGAIFDVVIDLRPQSKTYCKWLGFTLDDKNRDSLYIPAGIAHGFITLEKDSEILYMMGGKYVPSAA